MRGATAHAMCSRGRIITDSIRATRSKSRLWIALASLRHFSCVARGCELVRGEHYYCPQHAPMTSAPPATTRNGRCRAPSTALRRARPLARMPTTKAGATDVAQRLPALSPLPAHILSNVPGTWAFDTMRCET